MGQGALGRSGSPRRLGLTRRAGLLGSALVLSGCARDEAAPLAGGWVGAHHERGHRLHQRPDVAAPWPAPARRVAVLVVGGGVAGLAAARAFTRRGIDDVHLLELEDAAGGNSRGHQIAGIDCPLGAHYLPLPPPEAEEVSEWLHEIGLMRHQSGRSVPDERHLCHSPQERLFFEGEWIEGLLPPAAPGSARLAQYQRFAARVGAAQRLGGARRAFALPAHRGAWNGDLAALDGQTFAAWLAREAIDDPALLAYLDYCCRDDYGAGIHAVSAWAGLHYFASRHGFGAPGEAGPERDAVFTWPEGNAWLTRRLAAALGERLHVGRTALALREERHGVEVLAFNEARSQSETWRAALMVLALPLFVTRRLLRDPPEALVQAAALLGHAPWLVANLHLARPPLQRLGAAPAWDNVIHGARGLGTVDAMHQSLRPHSGATVYTAYHALGLSERAALLAEDWRPWAERVLQDLEPAHPDLRRHLQRIDLMRWGHAMAIPRPGVQRHPALLALRGARGRVRFAHSDLAGYSVFEEAFSAGCEAALGPMPAT